MSVPAPQLHADYSDIEPLREGREILRDEATAILKVSQRLDASFCRAADALCTCRGSVIVTGMGKAGLIGQKIAATLSSTGTRAHVLHPAEAAHGDLGCLHPDDLLLALSNSGETEELCRLVPIVRQMHIPIVAITACETSSLGSQADITICLGRLREAGPHGLAPSTSTTAMLAIGDALALVVSRQKGFTPQQFAVFHPAGSLGRRLMTVGQIMRRGGELRISSEHATIRQILVEAAIPGRRTGAVMLVDSEGSLVGLFTDSDLARLLEQHRDEQLDRPIAEVMTRHPITISPDALLSEIVQLLADRKISELPVVDDAGRPIGLIDITDVIGRLPAEAPE